jgi:hypothetical protein
MNLMIDEEQNNQLIQKLESLIREGVPRSDFLSHAGANK